MQIKFSITTLIVISQVIIKNCEEKIHFKRKLLNFELYILICNVITGVII